MWRRRWWSPGRWRRRRDGAGSRVPGGRANRMHRGTAAAVAVLTAAATGQGIGAMEDDSDEALMAAVVAGRQPAFRALMTRHMPRAIRVAQRIVRNAAEADDIGQEAFLRVWTKAASFDPQVARFTTWLYRIVLNLSFDRSRRPAHAPIEEAAEIASGEPAAVERLIADQQRRALDAAMTRLSDRQRGAIALFHMEGLPGDEAARAMGLSPKAFESLLARARLALKKEVETIEQTRRLP
ncbi:RNA polymerase sigma factor [Rhodopseudomonas sp. AAP120]|uniref:RNA polymerase sigma factor n=1 Tax=Rhodopseudomonas sp. AAP120 TaxID=1523430 RepID=UPI0006B91FEA|nr:RNA polymerase sigma factor [Rhodopseudomonas sp. AAP120]